MKQHNQEPQVPKWAMRFFQWYCKPDLLEGIAGDLEELFHHRAQQTSLTRARFRFVWDVIRFFRPSIIKGFTMPVNTGIIQSNFKIAARHLIRDKFNSALNISGLAIGLCCSLLILLWVNDEYAYDKHHEDVDRIYQVLANIKWSDKEIRTWKSMPYPLGEILRDEYPEIHIFSRANRTLEYVVAHGESSFKSKGISADPEFFELFTLPVLYGNPDELNDISSLFISESLAIKLFGKNWMKDWEELARFIKISLFDENEYQIKGVFSDNPHQSSLEFDMVLPIARQIAGGKYDTDWGNFNFRTYVKLKDQGALAQVNDRIRKLRSRFRENDESELFLYPFKNFYLFGNFENGQNAGGRITYVQIFLLLAGFILLIACINFINLSTARSAYRAKEIGIRKVVGAKKNMLIGQFISESFLITLFAILLALALVYFLLPWFNELTGKEMVLDFAKPRIWIGLLSLLLLVALLSGSYPALFLSSMNVVQVLKGAKLGRGNKNYLRQSLVVFQFSISVFLIICTFIIYSQIHFIQNKNLGFDKTNILITELDDRIVDEFPNIKQDLLKIPGVKYVTRTDHKPINIGSNTDSFWWEGKLEEKYPQIYWNRVDFDYFKTMDIEFVAGRPFLQEYSTDSSAFIINELAAEIMGLEDPLGTRMKYAKEGFVIGVVKNFHSRSLYEPIRPTVMFFEPEYASTVAIKYEPNRLPKVIAGLADIIKAKNPQGVFEYTFLDEDYENTYKSEMMVGTLAKYFSIAAILISCLGLFGLSTFTSQKRRKEISIRKILGASVSQLFILLSKEYMWLIGIAILISVPLGYYIMQDWLDTFAFRIDLRIGLFVLSATTALLLALLTISWQTIRTVNVNPADTLRDE